MRNRTNLVCALVWAFNAGVNLVANSPAFGLLAVTLSFLYGNAVWKHMKSADAAEKEAREKEKENEGS